MSSPNIVYISVQAFIKSIHLESLGSLKLAGKITFYNSAVHCATVLKFATLGIYESPENDLRFGRPPQVAVHR